MAQYTVSFRVPENLLIKVYDVGVSKDKKVSIGGVTFSCEAIKDDRLHVIGYLGYTTVSNQADLNTIQNALNDIEIAYYTRVTK